MLVHRRAARKRRKAPDAHARADDPALEAPEEHERLGMITQSGTEVLVRLGRKRRILPSRVASSPSALTRRLLR